MAPADIAFDFVERCDSHRSVQAVLDDFGACARQFGFEHFILTGLPIPSAKLEPLVLLNGWPAGWFERYNDGDYFNVDGVSQWAVRTHRPFLWRDVPPEFRDTGPSKQVAAEARSFNILDGFVVPMYSARHWQSAVSFATSRPCSLGKRELGALYLVAAYANGAVRQILGEPHQPHRLSTRERDILSWAAKGKTAWETAGVLTIAERTVEKHLEQIRRKLDVATTVQAVAEGIRCGEITP